MTLNSRRWQRFPADVEVIYILIPLSLVLVAVVIGFVIWAVNSGQFEDLERPGYRILDDDDGVHTHRKRTSTATGQGPGQDEKSSGS